MPECVEEGAVVRWKGFDDSADSETKVTEDSAKRGCDGENAMITVKAKKIHLGINKVPN